MFQSKLQVFEIVKLDSLIHYIHKLWENQKFDFVSNLVLKLKLTMVKL